jgi:hypothetical protein
MPSSRRSAPSAATTSASMPVRGRSLDFAEPEPDPVPDDGSVPEDDAGVVAVEGEVVGAVVPDCGVVPVGVVDGELDCCFGVVADFFLLGVLTWPNGSWYWSSPALWANAAAGVSRIAAVASRMRMRREKSIAAGLYEGSWTSGPFANPRDCGTFARGCPMPRMTHGADHTAT